MRVQNNVSMVTLDVGKFAHLIPRAAINRLLFTSSPTAVFRRIVSIDVDSIYSGASILLLVLAIRFTHIFKKIFIIIPAFTMLYSPASVIFIIRQVRVITSSPHINPRIIKPLSLRPIFTVRQPVRPKVLNAAATTISSGVIFIPNYRVPTLTLKQPSLFKRVLGVPYKLNSREFTPPGPPKKIHLSYVHTGTISNVNVFWKGWV